MTGLSTAFSRRSWRAPPSLPSARPWPRGGASSRRRSAASACATGGTSAALATSAFSRSSASRRFRSWLRWRCALMTTTPSSLRRRSCSASSRALTASGSDEAATSKRRWIALDTLLTFCPPAPWARTALISTSDSSTTTIGAVLTGTGRRRWRRPGRPRPAASRRRCSPTTSTRPISQVLATIVMKAASCGFGRMMRRAIRAPKTNCTATSASRPATPSISSSRHTPARSRPPTQQEQQRRHDQQRRRLAEAQPLGDVAEASARSKESRARSPRRSRVALLLLEGGRVLGPRAAEQAALAGARSG